MVESRMSAIKKTCCFTGHRKIASAHLPLLQEHLENTVRRLIEEHGTVNFIAGGALGFDTWAAECVLSLKKEYPQIKLLLALPCREQAARWSFENRERYEKILAESDKHIYVSEHYTRSCMHERNRFLVDHSSFCIAYCEKGARGGTAYTLDYAQKKGLSCTNIYEFFEE